MTFPDLNKEPAYQLAKLALQCLTPGAGTLPPEVLEKGLERMRKLIRNFNGRFDVRIHSNELGVALMVGIPDTRRVPSYLGPLCDSMEDAEAAEAGLLEMRDEYLKGAAKPIEDFDELQEKAYKTLNKALKRMRDAGLYLAPDSNGGYRVYNPTSQTPQTGVPIKVRQRLVLNVDPED